MNILILGSGNVGRAIATDLAGIHEVLVADKYPVRLPGNIESIELDASDTMALKDAFDDMELVICALPSFLGYQVLESCVEHGIDVVDVSFSPENPLQLQEAALRSGASVVVDAGFGPGLSNLFVGSIYEELDRIEECYIKIGGLPKYPKPPLFYESTWCTKDLIEEYTREARLVNDGKIVLKKPLESIEPVKVMGYEFEEFFSDGLRTLLFTVEADLMEETTLRWPGHLEKIRVLDELGFFKEDRVDDTLEVLAPLMSNSGNDVSLMTVEARGPIDGEEHTIYYELYDEAQGDFSSMSRTTGFTTASVARLVADGELDAGVIPLEKLGMNVELHDRIVGDMNDRGVRINRKTTYTL